MTRPQRKTQQGQVISDRMMKTRVVRVTRLVRHPVYNRVLKQFSTFKVHDERNETHLGDLVEIMETRPLSKDKRWRLIRIVQKSSGAPPVPDAEIDVVAT